MYSERVYELFAEWEQAQEEGTSFDLGQYANSPEYTQLTELIQKLSSTSRSAEENTNPAPAETRRYRFTDFIAQGGMGEVWRGFDKRMGRVVALKILRNRWGISAEKFREEAKLVSRMSHPGIAAVHDMDELPDSRPFFAMKLIEGVDLENYLTSQTTERLNLPECLRIFRQICETVGYAHELDPQLIHRDLKPQNIMIGRHGEVYVMDWGIAKTVEYLQEPVPPFKGEDGTLASDFAETVDDNSTIKPKHPQLITVAGVAKGTVAYMAPEQAQGKPNLVCPATDVFCLGGILCRILTGLPTFSSREEATSGDTAAAIKRLQTNEIDGGLAEIAIRCLRSSISERYQNANQLLEAIDSLEMVNVERLRLAEISEARRQTEIIERRRRRKWQYGLGSLAGILLCIATLLIQSQRSLEQQRADQLARSAQQAAIQLAEAKLLYKLAMERPLEMSGFEKAEAMAYRAIELAEHSNDSTTRSELATLLEAIAVERKNVPRNIQLLTDLANVGLPPAPLRAGDNAKVERLTSEIIQKRFTDAFRNRGFEWNLEPDTQEEFESNLKTLPDALLPPIAAAIDELWIRLLKSVDIQKDTLLKRVNSLPSLAYRLDNDDRTKNLRELVAMRILGEDITPFRVTELARMSRSIDLSREPANRILVLCNTLTIVNEHEAAIELLTRASQEKPKEIAIIAATAALYEEAEPAQWDRAIEYRRALTAINPRLALGLVYDLLHQKRSDEAEQVIRQLIRASGDSPETLVALGICLSFNPDRLEEEKLAYMSALKLQPDYAPARRILEQIDSDSSK
jgi:serine/threonine protein kinase